MKESLLKIGMVCHPKLGGSGIVATELGHQLARLGHEIHFISYTEPFRLNLRQDNIFFHKVELHPYEVFAHTDYALPLAVKMAAVAREVGLDIFHVHYAIPHATSALLARELLGGKGPKIITTLHGTDITLVGKEPQYRDIVAYSINQSDHITAVSNHLREETIAHFATEKEIEVIYNFFDPKPIHKTPNPAPLIVHSSNFRPVKRVSDVIEIFAKLDTPGRLLLVGDGSGRAEVEKLVRMKGLEGRVDFLGATQNIDPIIAIADLFLLPSTHESFGLSALEAMAYGVPVIASDVGGLSEVIEHGASGFLCPACDVDAFAVTAQALLDNPTLHKKISDQAKERAQTLFSPQPIISRYIAAYNGVY